MIETERQNLASPGALDRATLWLTIGLCAAFLLPGLIGHDPWKQDETYIFGIVYRLLQTGDWVVPNLAGQPFMEKPPLYYLTAAFFARAFSPWLPLFDGARLATGFFMGLTLLFTGLAGRELWGRGYGRRSVLLLVGCIGLLQNAHEMYTDMGLLTGFALAFYGLALSRRRVIVAGILLGTGVGVGFMSKGLIAPGAIGTIALVAPLVIPEWRQRQYLYCLLLALVAALPWLLIWPVMLYRRSPELFMSWFWLNNFGRYFGFAHLGANKDDSWFYARLLPWFAWPAWPFAIAALLRGGRAGIRNSSTQLMLVAITLLLLVLNLAAVGRDLYALPLLLPLALLGAKGLEPLPVYIERAFLGFSIIGLGALALFLWYAWLAVTTHIVAVPVEIARNTSPDFVPQIHWLPVGSAIAFTALWQTILWSRRTSVLRGVTAWVAGLTLVWGLVGTLWLPWVDNTRSYRAMIGSLRSAMPEQHGCMAGRNVGESLRGMLDSFANITVQPLGQGSHTDCDLLLVRSDSATRLSYSPGPQWRQIWGGSRPMDHSEFSRLYARANGSMFAERHHKPRVVLSHPGAPSRPSSRHRHRSRRQASLSSTLGI